MTRLVQNHLSTPRLVRRNRRQSERLAANQLPWLKRARFTDGPSVSVIDLSVHGALFEVDYRLGPGEATPFELIAADDRAVVTAHVIRTEVIGLGTDSVRYRGACVFDRPLPWSRLSVPAPPLPLPVMQATEDQPWSGWSEIRVTFRYGREMRGYTHGFHPSESVVHVWPSREAVDRERQTVPLSLLRRVAFVCDFHEAGSPPPSQRDGRSEHLVEVTFRDNEIIRGTIPGYDPEQIGFWIRPSHRPQPARIFAVSSAVREICFF